MGSTENRILYQRTNFLWRRGSEIDQRRRKAQNQRLQRQTERHSPISVRRAEQCWNSEQCWFKFSDRWISCEFLSEAAVQSLTSNLPHQPIHQQLQLLAHECTMVLWWIPAHCGISGNERADRLAKSGSKQLQPMSKTAEGAELPVQQRPGCISQFSADSDDEVVKFKLNIYNIILWQDTFDHFKW